MITKVVFTVGAVLRGDDAAGPMLAKMLEQSPIPGWTCIDGGQTPEDDLAVIRRMQPDVLLLVDASQMGREPGTILAFACVEQAIVRSAPHVVRSV